MLNCSVPQRTIDLLTEFSKRDGRSVETLAEDAIVEAALRSRERPEGRVCTSWSTECAVYKTAKTCPNKDCVNHA